jgi:dipeptidase E
MRLLLFSNSTNPGEEYLGYTISYIHDFIKDQVKSALFIPFAGVSISYDNYFQRVCDSLSGIDIQLDALHKQSDMIKATQNAEAIIVGGGNSFALLKSLQDLHLIDVIGEKVKRGTKYIGWSAGANLACPTIRTTNDMPIVEPNGLKALNLIPFQINPHFTDYRQPGHTGETREMRIEEFLLLNQHMYVAGLREGTLMHIDNGHIELLGNRQCRVFNYNKEPVELRPGDNLDFLLQ